MQPISLRQTYAGRHVLVTGASGFVGKVWLAMALARLPEIGRLYVLLRRKRTQSALERFEEIVGTSPVFRPLHLTHGAGLAAFLGGRVEVVEGDVGEPGLGIDAAVAARLRRDLDVMINFAGLVDFNPDIRDALSTNVDGALHAADFVGRCDRAALLHVSTCYVAGMRQGRIEEAIHADRAPNGLRFDAEEELRSVRTEVARILDAHASPAAEEAARDEALKRIHGRGRDDHNARLVRNMIERERRQRLKRTMMDEGLRRAARWGWPNTYTYSKGLAESLLSKRANGLRWSIFRPAIVESSVSFPFPGWNEGFNTSAPLIYLVGSTWFRHLPARPSIPFDVIPVDVVCKGVTIAGAGLMLGRHAPVYHGGTSDRNCLTLGRAIELTGLGKRRHLREHGNSAVERVILSRWDPITVEDNSLFSVPNLRAVVQRMGRFLRNDDLPALLKPNAKGLADHMDKTDRRLDQIEKALDLFKPFIYDHRHVFVSRAVDALPVVEEELRFEPEKIDWRAYWLDVHMPGLRRWCFPQLEGKAPESDHPATPFRMARTAAAASAASPVAPQPARNP